MSPDSVPFQQKEIYSWPEISDVFGFRPNYLSVAGGMISLPRHDTLLLITHPGGGRSFDYEDYWDGDDLIYTGKGQIGDQKLMGQNLDVAKNRRTLQVFEAAGARQLKYLGRAVCVDSWRARAPDKQSTDREILRFRLAFDESVSPVETAIGRAKFFGGGESDEHKELKEYVANHPELIGCQLPATAHLEHSFRSPDRADILIEAKDGRYFAVEIELAGATNTLVGAWQSIKYRVLTCLEKGLPIDSSEVRAVLVAYSIPESTQRFCERYGVKWYEIKPR